MKWYGLPIKGVKKNGGSTETQGCDATCVAPAPPLEVNLAVVTGSPKSRKRYVLVVQPSLVLFFAFSMKREC